MVVSPRLDVLAHARRLTLACPPHTRSGQCAAASEITVGRQQGERVANAELCKNSIDRANLQTGPTTSISQFRGIDDPAGPEAEAAVPRTGR
jgi:hypothetical protein